MHKFIFLSLFCLLPTQTLAHAGEQSIVLLLPTNVYIAGGLASVLLTVLLLALLPGRLITGLFRPFRLNLPLAPLARITTLIMTALLIWALWQGVTGARDPYENPLTLGVWTLWWITLVSLQGVFGNIWQGLSPRLIFATKPLLRYPSTLGYGPAIAGFLAFAAFLLADLAPTDPKRLGYVVGLYLILQLIGLNIFGKRWLLRAEFITVLMRLYARVGLLRHGYVGLNGWHILSRPATNVGAAIMIVCILGIGSFDGLNETFWWLALIGVNPLEFPGRSAVIGPTLMGIALYTIGLLAIYGTCLWLGRMIASAPGSLITDFARFAPSLLPIALAYHIAHYLPSALVEIQYLWKMLFADHHVTAGFFNRIATVRIMWLTQAGVIVVGHCLAILLSHALALKAGESHRTALVKQAPLILFMLAYTVFGLWLLASPRGA